ncbi:MAG: hydrogenase maturation protease [SAR324 cluster bacterium]|nr:hydrogenase maturation protease [SAR324 cluster bacterium]
MKRANKTLILGIGNILLADEGIGPKAVEILQEKNLVGVDLLDGGTGGFHLLGEVEGYENLILVDATLDQNPVGSIRVIKPKFAADYPPTLSAHDVGLKDLLDTAEVMGFKPDAHLVVMSVELVQPVGMHFSPNVDKAMPQLILEIETILSQIQQHESAA